MTIISTKITIQCNQIGCGKTHSVEGKDASRMKLFKSAKAAGWDWINAGRQLCPAHNKKDGVPVKKAPAKKASKPRVKKVETPAPSSE